MLFNPLLHFITRVINLDGIKVTNYDFVSLGHCRFRCTQYYKVFSEEPNFFKKRRTYTEMFISKRVVQEVWETNVKNII